MNIDFAKTKGLIPVIIQHEFNLQVLMLGYMNEEAYEKTRSTGMVTFFSRSRNELWTKGTTSGNYFHVRDMRLDCDGDTLLIKAIPDGPACHTGSTSCFGEPGPKGFLYSLESVISKRIAAQNGSSYIYRLFQKGMNKMAQKVGEEAVEVIIEAKDANQDLFKNEAADLLFHLLILINAKGTTLPEIEDVLMGRMK